MSRVKSEIFDNIFQTRTPEKKTKSHTPPKSHYSPESSPFQNTCSLQHTCSSQHACSQHDRYKNLCSPLPQKEGMNAQNYLILTPNRNSGKCNQGSCIFYTPQRGTYSSFSSYGSALVKFQYQQKNHISLDADDYQQIGESIDPFGFKDICNNSDYALESEKEDITKLRKDSINPHGKDLELLEGLIQQSQLQLGLYQSLSADHAISISQDPKLAMQEIETAWQSIEQTSPPLINQINS